MKFLKYLLVILYISENDSQLIEHIFGINTLRRIREYHLEKTGHTGEDPVNLRRAKRLGLLQSTVPNYVPFPCKTVGFRSPTPPESVDMVMPGDIDVIGAMGDSITAGVGLVGTTILNFPIENRGLSWSIGGQGTWRSFLTLPNILKEFNPNLFGYSLGDSLSIHKASQFNVGEPGAISANMPYMAQVLVERIKNDPRVNVEKHWKLITFMVGPNDVCSEFCYTNPPEKIIDSFQKNQLAVLRTIRDNLPRTIVNLVPTPHLRALKENTIENKPKQCVSLNVFECPCLFARKFAKNVPRYYKINEALQKVSEELANMDEFHSDTFSVVLQPFSENAAIPKLPNNLTDYSYMSQDCFHFSQKLNAAVANSLWNNMMEPQGQKSKSITPIFKKFLCPSEKFPYIFTKKNSI